MNKLLIKLAALQTAIIVLSNWLVTYKFTVFDNPLTLAVFVLPLSIVTTDLIVRLINKKTAQQVVLAAIVPGMILTAAVLYASGAPEYTVMRITIASGIANCLPVLADISVFAWVRQKFTQWWIAPATSGVVTSIIMTYIFYGTAFAFNYANPFMAENWAIVATNQVLGKMLMNLVILLPVYGLLLNYLQRKISDVDVA